MQTADETLLAGIATRDQGAFAEFYDRHSPRVLGLLLKMIRRRSDAEDVLQETFWHVWRIAPEYDPARAGPSSWLLMIARSRAIDHLRRKSTAGAARETAEPDAIQWRQPADDVVIDETRAGAARALERLPAEQQRVIRLAFYEGLTHEEIAAREALPLGTVKTRIRLGMQRLRDTLRPQHEAALS
jgi:RNA polymerase sigma-70 factor (ECF subfamily)